jgi:predicted transcriptional regulator
VTTDPDPLDYGARAAQLRAERAAAARDLRDTGMSLDRIADRLGVSKPTVVEDLRAAGPGALGAGVLGDTTDTSSDAITRYRTVRDSIAAKVASVPREDPNTRLGYTSEQLDAIRQAEAAGNVAEAIRLKQHRVPIQTEQEGQQP